MKFAFVILHYNTVKETQVCVKSIKERLSKNYPIIIVDNASPNGSGKEIQDCYLDDDQVHVILSSENLGFACGNNLGIYYARDNLHADFVVVLNNDTYLVQDDFTEVVESEWNYSGFAVMGPRVHTFSGNNQNPVHSITADMDQVRFWRCYHRCALIRSYLGVDSLWNGFKKLVRRVVSPKKNHVVQEIGERRQENVKLHGCCFVFSPKFFSYFKGFDPRTFMYGEEDILFIHVKQKQLLTVYNPLLQIFHAEKAATKSVSKTNRKKQIFVHRECLNSLNVIETVIQENASV